MERSDLEQLAAMQSQILGIVGETHRMALAGLSISLALAAELARSGTLDEKTRAHIRRNLEGLDRETNSPDLAQILEIAHASLG